MLRAMYPNPKSFDCRKLPPMQQQKRNGCASFTLVTPGLVSVLSHHLLCALEPLIIKVRQLFP